MAGPRKTTGDTKHVRVRTGSALERLTAGRNFTDTVHEVFEMYARAMGDQPVEPEPVAAPQPQFQQAVEPENVSFGGNSRDTHRKPRAQRRVQGNDMGQLYAVPDPETGLTVQVGYDEAMRLMKQQCPAGLEPVLDAFMIADEEGEDEEPWDHHDDVNPRRFDNVGVVEPEQEPFNYEQLA